MQMSHGGGLQTHILVYCGILDSEALGTSLGLFLIHDFAVIKTLLTSDTSLISSGAVG